MDTKTSEETAERQAGLQGIKKRSKGFQKCKRGAKKSLKGFKLMSSIIQRKVYIHSFLDRCGLLKLCVLVEAVMILAFRYICVCLESSVLWQV